MIFGLPLVYWGLWLAILILWMGRFVTSFLSIYLVSALHINEGVVGAVVSMYGFGSIIGCLFGGTLSDRFGRQSMIIIGEIGAAIALLVVSALTAPVAIGAALFVYGAFASLPSPAIAAYIADVVPVKRQQRAYVLQSWAINFGYAIGPIVANQLVKVSYSLMFYVEAAVMVAVTVLLIAFFREVRHLGITAPGPSGAVRAATAGADGKDGGDGAANVGIAGDGDTTNSGDRATADVTATSSDPGTAKPAAPSLRDNWRRVLTDVPFLAFSVLMFGYYLVYFQSTSGLPIAMTDLGLGLGEYSVLLTINGFMLCALQIPAMKLFARMGNSRVLVVGLAVTVVGYAVQIVAHSWAGFALAVVLWTLGELGTFPIATTTVAAMAPASARGTYQGVYNVIWSVSIALAPLVGGWTISGFGGRTLWIACTLVLIAVTIGLRLTKSSRDRAIARNLQDQLAG
ncbi:MFS transporter [Bifidobacterium miconisargentati]|uniref:MFS transporter n=1 Tax=Bifidobacterium miconisargentati TaxID=2834437 RepID=UPI001BDCFCA3|nr:MFS transporter [Bifidobacterium miconisargentati]MBW3091112.1 MFS transporter [Bifidobacterium miconisargentati]